MDEGHLGTELILKETEADVNRVYRQAAEEVEKKLNDYLRRFKVKDQIKREQLRKGEITQDEYNYWRTGQIMIGKRWEEMKNTLAQDLHNANNIARSITQGYMPEVYALNHNYATFQVEKDSLVDTSYTLYDRQTVERIMKDQPDLLPPPGPRKKAEIAAGKDIKWQRGQIQSTMMQSILQGESIPHIAQRMAKELSVKNRNSAVRYARTAATGAQNAGRVDGYKRAQGMGIELEQEWLATLDLRTRHEHRFLDGQHVPVGTPFKVDGEEIRFPGDPDAPGYLIWNCRCTLVPHLKNLDQSDAPRKSKLGDMSYEEWKEEEGKKHSQVTKAHNRQSGVQYKSFDSDVGAVKYSVDKWGEWREKLTQPEVRALQDYASSSNDINGYLREKGIPSYKVDRVKQQICNIDRAVSRGVIDDPLVTYRGVGSNYLGVDLSSEEAVKKAIGSAITDPGFMSTSLSREVAEDYRHGNGVIMEIKVPKGTHAAYIDMARDTAEELMEFAEDGDAGNIEYLLERGGTVNITGYTWNTDNVGRRYIKVIAEYMRL